MPHYEHPTNGRLYQESPEVMAISNRAYHAINRGDEYERLRCQYALSKLAIDSGQVPPERMKYALKTLMQIEAQMREAIEL